MPSPPPKPVQAAAAADDPVAGDDERDRVRAHRVADRAISVRASAAPRDLGVASRRRRAARARPRSALRAGTASSTTHRTEFRGPCAGRRRTPAECRDDRLQCAVVAFERRTPPRISRSSSSRASGRALLVDVELDRDELAIAGHDEQRADRRCRHRVGRERRLTGACAYARFTLSCSVPPAACSTARRPP